MVPIEDLRESEVNKKLPGAEELAKVVEQIPADQLLGVRRIVLFDDDPAARKEHTLARHRPIKGNNQAELDIFYERLRSHRYKGKNLALYALGELTELLYECLYTHQAVTRHIHRRHGAKEQRRRTEAFARARVMETLGVVLGATEAAKLKRHLDSYSSVEPEELPAKPKPS